MSEEIMIKNKLQRQLALYAFMHWTKYHNQYDVMVHFRYNNKRAMQRDFKDLEDAGVMKRKYVKRMKDPDTWPGDETAYKNDNYEVTELFSEPVIDPKRKHLSKLNYLSRVMRALPQTHFEFLEDYDSIEAPSPEDQNGLLEDAVAAYRKAFPDATEDDMERDFQELNDLGFYIVYHEKYHGYVVDIRFCSAERHFDASPRAHFLDRLERENH